MKRLFVFLAIGLLSASVYAEPDMAVLPIQNASTGAVTASSSSSRPLSGYLEEISIFALNTNMTGTVSLVIATNETYHSEVLLYTNAAFTTHAYVRPRFAQHDTAGNTNSVMEKKFMCNAIIKFRAGTLVYTNKDFKAVILFDNDQKR